MKNRFFIVAVLIILLVSLAGNAQAKPTRSSTGSALVFVKIPGSGGFQRFAGTGLPLYATLEGGVLTTADPAVLRRLTQAGLEFQVVDPQLGSGAYYLAQILSGRTALDYSIYGDVLLSLPTTTLLRMDPGQVDALNLAGAELQAITLTPKPLPSATLQAGRPQAVIPDPLIQGMIDQVTETQVYTYDRQLAGELPVWVDNAWYTITTRNTNSGTPIEKTTSWVGQHMADLGLNVEYDIWNNSNNPNVIGEIPGLSNPDDIYIIGAHIDDVNGTPGADDNASGSVATLLAADILSQFQWGCTLKFAFWTGEEQGLLGSYAYAQQAYQNGDNILGYLNLDMIAWNTLGSDPYIFLSYSSGIPASYQLSQLYVDVIDAYNINLLSRVEANSGGSDHVSFWDFGYNSILAIEDEVDDFNPYYHGPQDTPAHTDPVYFTNFVKSSIGTFAHLSNCLIPSGTLDGYVRDSNGGAAIAGAQVTASDEQGHSFSTTTDASGHYTRLLQPGTYSVTASTYGYQSQTIDGVVISSETMTPLDFNLDALPIYTISGHVYEAVSDEPLSAILQFTDAPVSPVNTDTSGYYSISVAEGTWQLQARSVSHLHQVKEVLADADKTVDFYLDPLPCALLVDDDNNNPDVTPYYTAALDALGYDYDIFDVGGGAENGPNLATIQDYGMVMWYSGDKLGGSDQPSAGPNATDEANLASYLDGGGKLFLDSQDYLVDFGVTPFGQNYLGVASFTNNAGDATEIIGITGDPVGDGLGPYTLTYPSNFTDRGDTVNPGPDASVSFKAVNNDHNLDLDKDEGTWQTAFFATSWVPIYNHDAANGEAVLQRIVNFLGGCASTKNVSITPETQTKSGLPGDLVRFEYSVTNEAQESQTISLTIAADWLTEVTTTTGLLAGGESATIPITVSVPILTETEIASDTFTLTAIGSVNGQDNATGTTIANVNPGVEVTPPDDQSGLPLQVVSYDFQLTNTGDYTDSFTLAATGVWTATLPAGDGTGPIAPGARIAVTVLVTIPAGVVDGQTDVTTLTAASVLDANFNAFAQITTTAVLTPSTFSTLLPIITR